VLPPALDRALTPPFAGLAAGEGAGGHAVDSQGGHAGQELEADYESMEKPAPEAPPTNATCKPPAPAPPPQAAAAFSDLVRSCGLVCMAGHWSLAVTASSDVWTS